MSTLTNCAICDGNCEVASNQNSPYTVYSCDKCGAYSLTNDLAEKIERKDIPAPHPDVFRAWIKKEVVLEELKIEGPLITEHTFRRIVKSLN